MNGSAQGERGRGREGGREEREGSGRGGKEALPPWSGLVSFVHNAFFRLS